MNLFMYNECLLSLVDFIFISFIWFKTIRNFIRFKSAKLVNVIHIHEKDE
jgi:hypothetical protein